MKAFLTLTGIELRLAMRNPIYMFFALAFPVLMMALFGGMYGNQPSPFYGGRGAVDMLTPAYIAMVVAVSGLMGLPLQLADYRQRKVLKRYEATPLGKATIMWPHFIVNGLVCALGIILLIIVGFAFFGLHFYGNLFYFILALLLSMLSIFSIGFLIAAVVPNSNAAIGVAYLVYFPMLFLSGATIPLQIMPPAVKAISQFLPLTYCVDLLQGVWTEASPSGLLNPILVLMMVGAVCTVLSVRFFRWES